ncbi:bacterial-like Sir2 family [Cryptosporidium bovis]|uniref:bacterial-like Sir2 family n=1 Tax=Cryptosporidium bovis TaxID=310047 RepID=UPI00351A138D|nr:bacterial-like Sir2 family [Cryptosporidium bovis]
MNTRVGAVLENLRKEVFESEKKILFVTGAGLSIDSGIPLFRSELDGGDGSAIWNSKLEDWATIRCFRENPEEWYLTFCDKFSYWNSFISAKPNEGHKILSDLCIKFPGRIKVITQNIDGLMRLSSCPEESIIEVHGRIDYLRCGNSNCEYSYRKYVKANLEGIASGKKIKKFYRDWVCPECKQQLLPLFLLFDETYTSHSYYQWEKAQVWMNEADIMIFIGTSFSVLCTDYCLFYAYKKKIPIYNVNIRPSQICFELGTSQYDFQVVTYPSDLTHNVVKTSTDFLKTLFMGQNGEEDNKPEK